VEIKDRILGMKVICQQNVLSSEQKAKLGYADKAAIRFELAIGSEYPVLGINFQSTAVLNHGVVVLLRDDIGRCAFVPICLLRISDPRVSKAWIAKKTNDFDVCLWPREFFAEYFHDDLSEGDKDTVQVFERVCRELDREFSVQLIAPEPTQ
jgi:hypothetical protein